MPHKKRKIFYQEKYKKGIVIDKNEIKKIFDDNFDDIIIEIREKIIYSDKTEGVVIELKF